MEDNPPDPKNTTLHERLLAGDLTAPAEIADLYLSPLVHFLEYKLPVWADPHLAETAAIDAIINYLYSPQQYNPTKADLHQYLRMAAHGDLLNLIEQQSRRNKAPNKMQFVELDAPGAENIGEEERVLSVEEQAMILASPLWSRLSELLPEPKDMQVVLLMMSDVRSTEDYATALGIDELPTTEKTIAVKRTKDRLKKWLQRHMSRSELQDHD